MIDELMKIVYDTSSKYDIVEKCTALEVIGEIGTWRDLESLRKFINDEAELPQIRVSSMKAYTLIGGSMELGFLEKIFSNKAQPQYMRIGALESIGMMKGFDVSRLNLKVCVEDISEDVFVRSKALEIIGRHSEIEDLDFFNNIISNKNCVKIILISEAIRIVGKIADKGEIPFLKSIMLDKNKNLSVRVEALIAIENIVQSRGLPSSLEFLKEIIIDPRENIDLQRKAIELFGTLKDEPATKNQFLHQIVIDEKEDICKRIIALESQNLLPEECLLQTSILSPTLLRCKAIELYTKSEENKEKITQFLESIIILQNTTVEEKKTAIFEKFKLMSYMELTEGLQSLICGKLSIYKSERLLYKVEYHKRNFEFLHKEIGILAKTILEKLKKIEGSRKEIYNIKINSVVQNLLNYRCEELQEIKKKFKKLIPIIHSSLKLQKKVEKLKLPSRLFENISP